MDWIEQNRWNDDAEAELHSAAGVTDEALLRTAGNEVWGPTVITCTNSVPLAAEDVTDEALLRAAANEAAGPVTGPRWTGACCGR
jgi:hypothetical protein